MNKLGKNDIWPVFTSFLLQVCLSTIAVYGIVNEVPRSTLAKCVLVALCLIAAVITFVLSIQKTLSSREKDKKLDEMHMRSSSQEKMIKYLIQNAKPGVKAVKQIERVAANIGVHIGFREMTSLGLRDNNGAETGLTFLAFKQNYEDEYCTAIFPMGPEEVEEVYYEAKDIDDSEEVRRAFVSAFLNKVAFSPSNEYLYDDIRDLILKAARLALTGCGENNLSNDPRRNFILRSHLNQYPKTPNKHICILRFPDGKEIPAYDFTKEQFDSLIGTTKFDACKKICSWFKDAGIDITGRQD